MKPSTTKSAAMKVSALFLLMSVASGCASSGTSFEGYCRLSSPIILSDKTMDAMSDDEVNAIWKHNDTWKQHCVR